MSEGNLLMAEVGESHPSNRWLVTSMWPFNSFGVRPNAGFDMPSIHALILVELSSWVRERLVLVPSLLSATMVQGKRRPFVASTNGALRSGGITQVLLAT